MVVISPAQRLLFRRHRPITDNTGPKISSRAMVIWLLTSRTPSGPIAALQAIRSSRPARQQRRPSSIPSGCSLHTLILLARDHRPILVAASRGSPTRIASNAATIVHALLHPRARYQQAGAGKGRPARCSWSPPSPRMAWPWQNRRHRAAQSATCRQFQPSPASWYRLHHSRSTCRSQSTRERDLGNAGWRTISAPTVSPRPARYLKSLAADRRDARRVSAGRLARTQFTRLDHRRAAAAIAIASLLQMKP